MEKTHYAVCCVKGDTTVQGVVKFVQTEGQKVKITARVEGMAPGLHGFHIHEFGNLTNGCVTAGPHYNPDGKTHAGPADADRHVGDLGNIKAGEDGVGLYELEDAMIMIYGERTIVGRSCVCHAGEDDLGKGGNDESLKTGNAGARLACGVIGLSAPF